MYRVPKGLSAAVLWLFCTVNPLQLNAQGADSLCRVELSLWASESPSEGASIPTRLEVVPQRNQDRTSGPEDLKTFEVATPGRVELDLLRSKGPWDIRATTGDHYAAPLMLDVVEACNAGRTEKQIVLHPTFPVQGKVKTLGENTSSKEKTTMLVQFESSPPQSRDTTAATARHEYKRDSLPCKIFEDRFECKLPPGNLDLRFELPGFAPLYSWDQRVVANSSLDLGILRFRKGSSIAGWIDTGNIESPEPVFEVSAFPQITGWIENPAQQKRIGAQAITTSANERGFFQVLGLRPNVYSLAVEADGFARTIIDEIEVGEGKEVELSEAIWLDRPATLEVYLDPPHDVSGEPWIIELAQPAPRSRIMKIRARSKADTSGYWELASLELGTYQLEVIDSSGNRWLLQDIEVTSQAGPLQLQLESVAVKGMISKDGEPVETDVFFGTRYRRPSVNLSADSNGNFVGILPRQGPWEIEIAVGGGDYQELPPVDVLLLPGENHAWLEINIPATSVEIALTRGGLPASGSIFVRDMEKGKKATNRQVGDGGRIEINGLAPGRYSVIAHRRGESSGVEEFVLEESQDQPTIHLELQAQKKVAGHVVYQGGAVAGARVFALPALAGPLVMGGEGATDHLGRFEMQITSRAQMVDVLVTAGGLGVKIERFRTDSEQTPVISMTNQKAALVAPGARFLNSYLHHGQSAIAVEKLIPPLMSAGYQPLRNDIGLVLDSLTPGEYYLCPGAEKTSDCVGGWINAGSELVVR